MLLSDLAGLTALIIWPFALLFVAQFIIDLNR
jgi:hypothetical protein